MHSIGRATILDGAHVLNILKQMHNQFCILIPISMDLLQSLVSLNDRTGVPADLWEDGFINLQPKPEV